jgi:hypothetical protein
MSHESPVKLVSSQYMTAREEGLFTRADG